MSWIDQRPDDAMDGAFTAVAPEPAISSVDAAAFRDAMSRLGAAVHVVTSAGPGGKTGFTATAVCSVSDQPATLLVCLNRRAKSAPLLAQNGVFCVNTLGADEEKLADLFAGKSGVHLEERFNRRRMDHAENRLAGARLSRHRLRLPHHRHQGGGLAQRAVRRRRSGAARPAGPALVYHDRLYKKV